MIEYVEMVDLDFKVGKASWSFEGEVLTDSSGVAELQGTFYGPNGEFTEDPSPEVWAALELAYDTKAEEREDG